LAVTKQGKAILKQLLFMTLCDEYDLNSESVDSIDDARETKANVEATVESEDLDAKPESSRDEVQAGDFVEEELLSVRPNVGSEAVRTQISYEISYIMNANGIGIDSRHLLLLADVMTFWGTWYYPFCQPF
jgi:DNA-directed RNA polymerase III subunit RPC1